ncbi:MAG: hypothetical protein QM715_02825 [Nibricoccus sp.]
MDSSTKPNDKAKPAQSDAHPDALSGWGALVGTAAGALIGVFFHKAVALAIGLGVTGWIVGALIDRSRR